MDELECSAECEREVCSILGYCPYIKELEEEKEQMPTELPESALLTLTKDLMKKIATNEDSIHRINKQIQGIWKRLKVLESK